MKLPRGVRDIRRLRLNPDDRLVVQLSGPATRDKIDVIREQLQPRFPDNEILIVDRDTDLLVVGADPDTPLPRDPMKGTN